MMRPRTPASPYLFLRHGSRQVNLKSQKLWKSTSSKESGDQKTYTNTLHLPKTSFPIWSEPLEREEPFRDRTTQQLYRWQSENAKGPLYVLHDGPPYANGNLHMGHALNKILKDIINRYQVLQGRRVSYIPGWDCHGLPIENKALKELDANHRNVSSTEIRQAARQVAVRDMDLQRGEFQQFGIMADWSEGGTYRTLDHDYEIRQLRVFQALVQKGLIYRHYRPVHWSPSSNSALAEAELVYVDDHKSRSVYVKFKLQPNEMSDSLQRVVESLELDDSDPISLLIWTTTPWTLPANMAVAVNPGFEYLLIRRKSHPEQGTIIIGKDRLDGLRHILGETETLGVILGSELLGTGYTHLFHPSGAEVPRILPATFVTSDSGTGLVHMAPAHGAEDYAAFKDAGLLAKLGIICPVDGDGKYTKDILPENTHIGERLIGKEVLYGGTKEIIKILEENHAIIAEERIKHRYPYDWKTKKPIIVRATSQWFANVDAIKDAASNALKSVKFYPEQSRARLEAFVRERSEWCISRQRTWGVPIPALHDAATDEAILSDDSLSHIIAVMEKHGVKHWFDGPVEDFLTPELKNSGRQFRKGTDTVDVWFDSGTSWSLIQALYGVGSIQRQVDICVEGSDQHRGWFQSLLLTSIGSSGEKVPVAPYKALITHGFVLDEKGKKMSKSVGNVISPLTILHGGKDKKKEPAYGADVLRLWAATVEYGKDVSLGPKVLSQALEALRKVRNTVRFLLANLSDGSAVSQTFVPVKINELSLVDRYVMHQLFQLEKRCKEGYESNNFARVVAALTSFANTTLSSLYFDITKDTLYADAPSTLHRRAVMTTFNEILQTIVPILAPIMPHMAEEAHEVLKGQITTKDYEAFSVFTKGWRPVDNVWEDPKLDSQMQALLNVRSGVFELMEQARRQKLMGSSLEASVEIVIPPNDTSSLSQLLRAEENLLKTLFISSDAVLLPNASNRPAKIRY
ncbi:isoleucine-tRNA ligase [Tulasnella sp. 419]|nr:isoleucine-tRNA ligase [Tulasnella sp. 419]